MKKNTFYTLFLATLFLFVIVGCKNKQEKELQEIQNLENQYFSNKTAIQEPANFQILMEKYVAYADNYPQDTLSPELMMRAADIAANLSQPGYAITLYNRIYNDYPNFVKRPYALFMIGFVNENNIGDWDKAKEYYERFIHTYPDHEMAVVAKACLENLGLSTEELILKIMQQQDTIQ